MKKLNLGAGQMVVEGVESHDINKDFNCDHSFDMRFTPWPLEENTYDKVYLLHTIEHIEKAFHKNIFLEVHRILKPDGVFVIAFPEFEICARYWIENHRGMRDFWEKTIFGRQSTNSDYHLCAVDCEQIKDELVKYGFKNIAIRAEKDHDYNTVIHAMKDPKGWLTYEHVVYQEVIAKQ